MSNEQEVRSEKREGNHIMLDLETLGTGANAVIVSVGAYKFGKRRGESFYDIVDIQSCMDIGLEVDADTISWWMGQSEDSRQVFSKRSQKIVDVLISIKYFIGEEAIIWGNGSDFDNVILANAYRKAGMVVPWDFHNNRCYRTVKNMYPEIAFKHVGTRHHALDDAKSQAEHVLRIFEQITEQ